MIFSDVYEGQHKPADLERLIDPKYLYSNYVEIVRLHSVTKAKMKKACFTICKLEKIQPPDWEEFNLECNGDIRHAIMTLQLRGKNNVRNAQENRDIKLSTFHALGKILYAKRQKVSVENGERPPLEFNPEKVMEDSEMGLGGALTFLGYHCPEFFNDIVELSDAFDRFSDAANLLDLNIDSPTRQANAIFPNGYVASLAGRAIADANKHPASSTFRALSAPKVFEAYRKARANRLTMLQLCKRLTVGSGKLSLDANIGGSRTFITDHLPLMKIILPNGRYTTYRVVEGLSSVTLTYLQFVVVSEINSALGTLYSFVIPNQSGRLSTTEDFDSKIMVEQAEILAEDDIVDDDDDSIDQVRFSTVAAIKITQSESDDGKETRAVAIPHDIIVIDD
jgi:cell cycle checkpoint protein